MVGVYDSKDRDQIDRLIAKMKRRGFLSKEGGDFKILASS